LTSAFLTLAACDNSITGSSDGGGANRAVVVGISQYRVPSFNLSFADDDALDYFNALVQGSNWSPGEITVLLNGQATRSAILEAINSVGGSLGSDDKFVFFFSGHGTFGPDVSPVDEADGVDEYIVPHDALSNSAAQNIRDDELELVIRGLPTRNVLVVLDSSFSGGMIKASPRPVGKVKFVDQGLMIGAQIRKPEGVFRDLDVAPGVITQTASQANQSPLESSALRNGVFTFYLVEGMLGPADPNGDSISAQEAFVYAAPRATAFFPGQNARQQDNRGSPYTLIIK
jgi:uncharacterized caspase-like protein